MLGKSWLVSELTGTNSPTIIPSVVFLNNKECVCRGLEAAARAGEEARRLPACGVHLVGSPRLHTRPQGSAAARHLASANFLNYMYSYSWIGSHQITNFVQGQDTVACVCVCVCVHLMTSLQKLYVTEKISKF